MTPAASGYESGASPEQIRQAERAASSSAIPAARDDWPGHLYDLTLADTEFRATGLDAAYRISKRLQEILWQAMSNDGEIRSIVSGPYLEANASPKNWPEK